jgi:gamma-butyrobetaine dioxygenase
VSRTTSNGLLLGPEAKQVKVDGTAVVVRWADGHERRFATVWLRDNCPCTECSHPGTGERLLDTVELADRPVTRSARLDGSEVVVVWSEDGHVSSYRADWLRGDGPADRRRVLWRADLAARLPEARHEDVTASDQALRDWLEAIDRYGFAVLRGAPAAEGEVLRFVELFGHVRETNYGRLFDVRSVVEPNNLAYTGLALGPHTDNPYREPPPTLQILHCISSSATGGESTLVDGFAVAEALRADAPKRFDLLTRHPVRFGFRDAVTELESEAPVIELDLRDGVRAIRYSPRAVRPFELPEVVVEPYYDAYRAFGRMLGSSEFQIGFKLDPGDLFIVDNRRVLHGRAGYSGEGTRHLQGAYADVDGLRSRLAVLSR